MKEIQTETAAVRIAVEEQKERIDRTTEEVMSVVTEMREGEIKTRDEMREIRDEVNNIREMLPKVCFFMSVIQLHSLVIQMIDKNKESQNQSLAELQQELKSLKTLLLSRGPVAPSVPSSPMPLVGRAAIPAWQLANTDSLSTVSSPTISGLPPSVHQVNGKTKELDAASS